MKILSIALPVFFIIAAKWILPPLTKRFGDKAKTIYFVIAFVIIILLWYIIDTHYGFHMGLW
jgi:Kef-type K+ transport system membrane component KefB